MTEAVPDRDALSGEQRLTALAALSSAVARTQGLDACLSTTLLELGQRFGYEHVMLLVPEGDERLVMLACRGYQSGGVGAELRFGEGVIGVAAERRTPINIAHVPRGISMLRAAQARMPSPAPTHAIPLPGLASAHSQLAVPGSHEDKLVLVIFVEDTRIGRFSESDLNCLQIVANQLATQVAQAQEDDEAAPGHAAAAGPKSDRRLTVRYYESDGSIFFDDEYVIKSLPGRILYKLLNEYLCSGRVEFSKKELRLDASLQLPAVRDNLDTRLILLRRRLQERFPFARIEASGRGRFRLHVEGNVELVRCG